jgi:hypothetical protein
MGAAWTGRSLAARSGFAGCAARLGVRGAHASFWRPGRGEGLAASGRRGEEGERTGGGRPGGIEAGWVEAAAGEKVRGRPARVRGGRFLMGLMGQGIS